MDNAAYAKDRAWRKVAALLAGGIVAGIGAHSTIASSGGSEFLGARVGAGIFSLQGSADGAVYADHSGRTDSPATRLTFSLPLGRLSPNDRVYLPFSVRLARGSDYSALVTVHSHVASGTDPGRSLVYRTPHFGCSGDADVQPGELILDTAQPSRAGEFEVAKPSAGADGEPVSLCFVVQVRPDLAQGAAGTILWSIQGVSVPE